MSVKKMDNTKIIDWETCGNVIRFYLGDMNNDDYWGDDWDDVPYEYNAGRVHYDDILYAIDIGVPLTASVIEANAGYENSNSPYSKECIKRCEVPCIGIIREEAGTCYYDYTIWDNPDVIKIFMGMKTNVAIMQMLPVNANILATYVMDHKNYELELINCID